MRILKYFFLAAAAIILIYLIFFRETLFQEIRGKAFNTTYSIKIKTPHKNAALSRKIQTELEKVNEQMSVFEPGSEINIINETPAQQIVELSDEMSKLLQQSYNIYKMSNGSFDPTVGKLIDLWGFGTKKTIEFPKDDEIKAALKQTGFNKIHFSSDYKNLKKDIGEVNINLSAIAKGYAVDKVAELLRQEGYKDFVIEIGGEVTAEGEKSEQTKGWNVGIKSPDSEENAAVVTLHNLSVATSGDYRNYFYYHDKRYSHTIIPQTGYPVEHKLASVSVFNKSCMMADGLATAIMVLGEEQGMKFADRHKIPAVFFVRTEGSDYEMLLSQSAQKLLGK